MFVLPPLSPPFKYYHRHTTAQVSLHTPVHTTVEHHETMCIDGTGGPVVDLTYDVAYSSGWQTFYQRHSLASTPSHHHRLCGLTVSPTHSSLHHEPQGAWTTLSLEGWFIHSLIRSFNKHILKQYFMTSSVLDTGDMKKDHTCSIIKEPKCAIRKSR